LGVLPEDGVKVIHELPDVIEALTAVGTEGLVLIVRFWVGRGDPVCQARLTLLTEDVRGTAGSVMVNVTGTVAIFPDEPVKITEPL
jgi:hypothetical protein